MERLQEVAALVAAGRRIEASAVALAVWRERPATSLAELIERLTPAGEGSPTQEQFVRWTSAQDLRAIAGLRGLRKVRLAPAEERVRAYLGWSPDPRLGAVVAEVLVDVPFTSDSVA